MVAAALAELPVAQRLRTPQPGGWFLALDRVSVSAGHIAEFLASNHLPAVAVTGEGHRLGLVTAPASHAVLLSAIDALEATGVGAEWWPVLEVGHV